jgi:hypothetical protein
MIGVTEEFPGPLGGSIRGDGLDIEVLLGEWGFPGFPINRRRGGEDEVFHSKLFAAFQEHNRPSNIDILVKQGICNGRPHPCPGCQMDDQVNLRFLEGLVELLATSNIAGDQFKLAREFSY